MFLINILSLKRRQDRRESLIRHLKDFDCLYKFWDAPDDRLIMPFINICRGHKMIVEDARDNGYEFVIIAEDDMRFSSKNSLNYFLETMPESFDMWFGCIFTGTIQDRRITHGFSGLQFYAVSRRFYDILLSADEKKHIDMWLSEQCYKYEFYVSDPFICYGESGHSDNFNRQWVFNESKLPRNLLKDEV